MTDTTTTTDQVPSITNLIRILDPADIKVGPHDTDHGTVYRYLADGLLSRFEYANAASARLDASRPQLVTTEGLEPISL